MRVLALKRLFEREANSPRLFRHQIYARIAERDRVRTLLDESRDATIDVAQRLERHREARHRT